ncbi:MAG: S-layer homology domain-containing protein, partial [Deltaproteobacteria bacterium]
GAARFRAVPRSHWAARAIAAVADAGFLRGYSDGTFAPDRRVTREEALVALANGLALTGGASADLAVRYTDATSVSSWAANGVAHADRNGLLDNGPLLGAQRRLRPRESATRAEVVSFIARARRRS